VHGLAARGPDHHHHPTGEKSNRLKTLFTIVDTGVFNREYRTGQHDLRVQEIELPVMQILRALKRIKCD
jgi:hypothetical protein